MRQQSILMAAALFGVNVMALRMPREGEIDSEDLLKPNPDYPPIEAQDDLLELVEQLGREYKKVQKGGKKPDSGDDEGEGDSDDDDDKGGWLPKWPWSIEKPKIPSEEAGRRFLKKYCSGGKCKLPKRVQITNKQRNIKKGAKKPVVRKGKLLAESKVGLAALKKSVDRTQGKVHHRPQRRIQGKKEPIMHPWGKGDSRDDRPIKPLQNGKKRMEKKIIVVKSKGGSKKDRPSVEVNQINLHFDVDIKQQQAQKEEQALVEGADNLNPGEGRHRHQRSNIGRGCEKRKGREMLSIPVRRPNRQALAIASRRAPSKPDRSYEEDMERWNDKKSHKKPRWTDPKSKKKCAFVEWGKKAWKQLGEWKMKFEEEPIINQLAMVIAIGAIVTLQVIVLAKFLGMFTGYRRLPNDDDDEEGDGDMLGKQESGFVPRHCSDARRSNPEKPF